FWIWIRRSARITRCSASCAERPRSRNTLPLDGVTFSLPFAGIGPSPVHERAQAILRELQIVVRRLPRPLFEGVQDIHGFGKGGDVEDTVVPSPCECGSRGRRGRSTANIQVLVYVVKPGRAERDQAERH